MSSDPQWEAGVAASNIVVQAFRETLAVASKHFRESETSFLKDELLVRERIGIIDKMVANLNEERRVLEVQLQDARNQSSHAKKKSTIVTIEVDRVNQLLTQQLAQLDEDERKLNEQQKAAKAKVEEVMSIASALDERLHAAQESERAIEDSERQLYHKERDYENAKREMFALEQEVEGRRRSLERKESSIASWMKALEAREGDLATCQARFREDLERIEREEQRHNPSQNPATASGGASGALSQRAVMDDHGMTIDRDEEASESSSDDS